ncbi:MAG TPA: NAD(P)H-dependent oxidoreductase [Propionibacteriaceae bacterium]|nr:NAD(P)H-dependent oxidoreductase [Propionibacteriaceae bacterium]
MSDPARGPLRSLVFSAALREQSLNSRLARLAAQTIEEHGGAVDLAGLAEFDAPPTTRTSRTASTFRPGPEEFRRRVEASDAFVIASPECNAAMPGLLKNEIDWGPGSVPSRSTSDTRC